MVFCRQNQFIVGFYVLKGPGNFHDLFVQINSVSLNGLEKLKKMKFQFFLIKYKSFCEIF
jgi:hypothetical protein